MQHFCSLFWISGEFVNLSDFEAAMLYARPSFVSVLSVSSYCFVLVLQADEILRSSQTWEVNRILPVARYKQLLYHNNPPVPFVINSAIYLTTDNCRTVTGKQRSKWNIRRHGRRRNRREEEEKEDRKTDEIEAEMNREQRDGERFLDFRRMGGKTEKANPLIKKQLLFIELGLLHKVLSFFFFSVFSFSSMWWVVGWKLKRMSPKSHS